MIVSKTEYFKLRILLCNKIQKKRAAKGKARKALLERYEILLRNVDSCYEVEKLPEFWINLKNTGKKEYTLRIKSVE